jgi:phage shock protein PspC (stress-responsive transcriptional regulator)
MNKVITINLNGNAYQLEEDGYEALRTYLESAARRLEGNPDKAEIIADIEQSIGDKFRAVLGVAKTVVVTKEVEDVIAEMGPVQDASGDGESAGGAAGTAGAKEGPGPASGTQGAGPGSPKRLYKIRDGAMIGGVCNGLAAYFGIDVTIVRIVFAFLGFMWGSGALLYILMMIILPRAETAAEKAAAYGAPSTAEEFIKRAKAGYYGGMRTFGDKKAYREWKRQFKQEMRQHKRDFQREIHQNIDQWRQNWRQHWGQHPQGHDSWIAGSFLSLLITIVTLVGLCAVLSLIFTGAVFSFALPAGIPLWMGIILLFLVFHIIKWPLRAARHSVYYHGAGGPGYWCHGSFFGGTFVWLAFLVLLLWVANHHSAKAHEVLEQVRHQTHAAVDSLRDWWDRP